MCREKVDSLGAEHVRTGVDGVRFLTLGFRVWGFGSKVSGLGIRA